MKMIKRHATGKDQVIDIQRHIILTNFWEYYVIELPDDDGRGFALVLGNEDEMGTFLMDEIKPHILSDTVNLTEVSPAVGWAWL